MKKLDRDLFNKWLGTLSTDEAMTKLKKATEYSIWTIHKIMTDRYPFEVKLPQRIAIAKVCGLPEDKLWKEQK